MFHVFIISEGSERTRDLRSGLIRTGFTCSIGDDKDEVIKSVTEQTPDLVLIEMNGHSGDSRLELLQKIKHNRHLPVMALANKENLKSIDDALDVDDFIILPCDTVELALRTKRLLRSAKDVPTEAIRCDDLVIDLTNHEVSLVGRRIALTFKEYELLKFLASNRGRVFSREALLNRVWGYDYYGGDRTVDVHIRRLRSKVEDSSHTFIETIRNIGYRFTRGA